MKKKFISAFLTCIFVLTSGLSAFAFSPVIYESLSELINDATYIILGTVESTTVETRPEEPAVEGEPTLQTGIITDRITVFHITNVIRGDLENDSKLTISQTTYQYIGPSADRLEPKQTYLLFLNKNKQLLSGAVYQSVDGTFERAGSATRFEISSLAEVRWKSSDFAMFFWRLGQSIKNSYYNFYYNLNSKSRK